MTDLTPSPACCRTAPPAAPTYKQEGIYVKENGMKTYETGSDSPTHAILYIYDIFGLYPQTLRGADILAKSIAEKTGSATKVFMPDWFSEPADISMYPPDTPEKMKYILDFFAVQAAPNAIIPQIDGLMKAMVEKKPTIKSWGIVGYCWGGKVLLLLLFANSDTDSTRSRLQLSSPDQRPSSKQQHNVIHPSLIQLMQTTSPCQ
jgi:dienelactone hydrolase